jgi:hypothetical protein
MTWQDFWKKVAKPILWILGILAAVLGAIFGIKKVVEIVREVFKGEIKSPMKFGPTDGMPGHITIFAPWGEVVGKLPAEIPVEKVQSAEAVKGGGINVEILHEATDRRSMLISSDCNDCGD